MSPCCGDCRHWRPEEQTPAALLGLCLQDVATVVGRGGYGMTPGGHYCPLWEPLKVLTPAEVEAIDARVREDLAGYTSAAADRDALIESARAKLTLEEWAAERGGGK